MDTGTHLVIGLGLAGLAHVDPVVAADTGVATAVMVGTVLGSQAPDTDTLLRLRGNAVYIKNHRGLSHSLPALVIWTLLITGLLSLFLSGTALLHAGLWVFGAVCFHVFTDLFNTYGTQALRPLSEKWVSWNIIHIFDPFIFVTHLIAIFLWVVRLGSPQIIFPILYTLIAFYYIWRTVTHHRLEQGLAGQDAEHAEGDRYYLIPTVQLTQWNVVKRKQDGSYRLGELKNRQLRWLDEVSCSSHPAVDASRSHTSIASFLYFSSFACAEVREFDWGYEVRWADVRYRHRKQYPFVAVLRMNLNFAPIDSYVGWKSESAIEKKLRVDY
ncbi:hypothetical protein J31TS4_40410 [Paenibacillus sp. J31TS4]|uniref:metal-dependent hydrolase n=1 Tax=Paenibacillus sp. J31TS4 TaxID=2807195 RepID=UPI001B18E5AB|nr:metal-dependent hydrolase [Paenibacillus sp. J31TS4]GIP40761.1 hypothetical protein J31TS4_40410 [Paenibacillus sp. J31TS4]